MKPKKKKSKFARNYGKGITIKVPEKFRKHEPKVFYDEPPLKNIEDNTPEPNDKIAKHKYPPPRKDKIFREKWTLFIDNVVGRKNFHLGHLETLKILCDCFVEYEKLCAFLADNGMSYCSIGRQGEQWHMYPHVTQRNRVKEAISTYSRMLDLIVKKDEGLGGSTGDDGDWK